MALDSRPLHEKLRGRPIHIVGCGSLGAKLFLNLYRKNAGEMHLWDSDHVEARNLYNQPYSEVDIGAAKTAALLRIAHTINGSSVSRVVVHEEKMKEGDSVAGIVFSAVDTNAARYDVLLRNVRLNQEVSFFSDGRVGMDGGKAYGFDPCNEWHIACYESLVHNHPDPEVVAAACKTEFPMPENSDKVAAEMLWRLNQWLEFEQGCPDPYMNFLGWCYTPRYSEAEEYWDEED